MATATKFSFGLVVLILLFVAGGGFCASAPEGEPGRDGSCIRFESTCFMDPDHVLDTLTGVLLSECCKSCSSNTTCQSYTYWWDSEAEAMVCHLFDDVGTNTTGNCTSGAPYFGPKRPNFVFYFPDTIRAESMSLYGHPLNTTPNIDEFAKSAVTFDQLHVQHSQCSPSRCAMLTGRYMHVLGHRTQTHLVQTYEPNFFRELVDAGYYVLWLGKNDVFAVDTLPLSASEWHEVIGVDHGTNPYPYPAPGYYSFKYTGSKYYGNDSQIHQDYKAVLMALDFINSNPPEPYFVFIPGIGAHPPYGAPVDFNNMYSAEEIMTAAPLRPPYNPGKPQYHSATDGIPYWRNLTTFNDTFFYEINAMYLGMVSYMDWIFGQLINGIDESGQAENIVVMLSSDHGDMGGDFHMVEKWPGGLDDILTHVPLVVRVPGGAQDVRIQSPFQSIDILETVMSLAGINVTWNRFSQSLVEQVVEGIEGNLTNFVYSEGGFFFYNELFPNGSDHVTSQQDLYWPRAEEEMTPNGSPKACMIRNLTHKMVLRPLGISELYDYTVDPRELNNVYLDPAYLGLRLDLTEKLALWLVQTADVTPVQVDPRNLPPWTPSLMGVSSVPYDGALPHSQNFFASRGDEE